MITREHSVSNPSPALLAFRAEFRDVKSIADVCLLSPDRLAKFRREFPNLSREVAE
jgi:hypothetical protein